MGNKCLTACDHFPSISGYHNNSIQGRIQESLKGGVHKAETIMFLTPVEQNNFARQQRLEIAASASHAAKNTYFSLYGPSFFFPDSWPKRAGHESRENNEDLGFLYFILISWFSFFISIYQLPNSVHLHGVVKTSCFVGYIVVLTNPHDFISNRSIWIPASVHFLYFRKTFFVRNG